MDQLFEISLELAPSGSRESARVLFQQLRAAIIDGRLATGVRLPSARRAKQYFGVSRNTAAEVYERLRTEGLIATRAGSGSYVARQTRAFLAQAAPAAPAMPDARLNPFWRSADVQRALYFWQDDDAAGTSRDSIDFRPALVDPRLFPYDIFRQASARSLRGLERRPARFKSPQGNQGNYHLRLGISKHLSVARAVVCEPEVILVTAGAQQAFDVLARTLVAAGCTTVAVEDPGYPPMRVPFLAAGARVTPVPVDGEGLVVEALPADTSLICVCPSHQFPLGTTLSVRRRRALLEFARRRGALIIEDDYDGEFRHSTQAIEPLRSKDTADLVFYVGTFSKCMLPSLRLGYLVAPNWAMPALVAAKNALDWHCPTPMQTATAGFISAGHLARHVRRMRRIYEERRQVVTDLITARMSRWLELVPTAYGMQVASFIRNGADAGAIAQRLAARNVRIHSLDRYYQGESRRSGLVFGLGTTDPGAIRRGLAALQETIEEFR